MGDDEAVELAKLVTVTAIECRAHVGVELPPSVSIDHVDRIPLTAEYPAVVRQRPIADPMTPTCEDVPDVGDHRDVEVDVEQMKAVAHRRWACDVVVRIFSIQ